MFVKNSNNCLRSTRPPTNGCTVNVSFAGFGPFLHIRSHVKSEMTPQVSSSPEHLFRPVGSILCAVILRCMLVCSYDRHYVEGDVCPHDVTTTLLNVLRITRDLTMRSPLIGSGRLFAVTSVRMFLIMSIRTCIDDNVDKDHYLTLYAM